MLRPLESSDIPAVQELVVAAGMFSADEVGFLADELAPRDPGAAEDGDDGPACAVMTNAHGIVGVAYYRPEEAADGVWDLTMIAVDPRHQRTGVGRTLIRHVEDTLSAAGARLLAVRTSGTGQYRSARDFYERGEYTRAATVADWWADDDDLVLYVKRLAEAPPRA